jgi:glycosyltransferase involved in cell wall biosynthesis
MVSVLLVTQDLQRAGAQRQCVELALGLARTAGYRVEVMTLEPGGALTSELENADIPIHVCPRRWRWDLLPVAAIAEQVGRGGYDVVHSFLFLPNFYTRVARLLRRPPVLISSLRSTGIDGGLRYAAEVLMAPLCDAIIANSDAGKADLMARGVSAKRIQVVRNGLDFSRFEAATRPTRGADDGPRRLGMVAQMEGRKDHVGLVEAFARVTAQRPSTLLVLAGDGTTRPQVEERVRRLGLETSVSILGTVDRVETVLATLDIYVQASAREEGTSNSILEAMASGLPVVATDIGGNREVVQHGETGLIVPPRDPGALADALLGLLADPERCRALGAAGASLVRRCYAREVMIDTTVGVYRTLLGKSAPSGASAG